MDIIKELNKDPSVRSALSDFCELYGTDGLKMALRNYTEMKHSYICKTKTSAVSISVWDIMYLQIANHQISIHTTKEIYYKYGTLKEELKNLSSYGFVKCNQSTLVSLKFVKYVHENEIFLLNDECLHISRTCTRNFLIQFLSR